MNYLIYTRVSPKGSTWNLSETTVGDQAAQCRSYVNAVDPDGVIIDTITDEFESGGSSKRPGWLRIMRDLKTGNAEWDVLVVRHLDRFSRSVSDAVNALELFHDKGKHLIAFAQGLNSSTPSGRGVINILLSIAQMEREFASERVKLKMASIARAGGWPSGHTPYGYKRGEAHDNKLYVDEDEAEILRDLFLRYSQGVGPTELARKHGILKNRVINTLKNRTCLGLIAYGGNVYKGKHDALVSEELFEKVQTLFPISPLSPRPTAQKYPYLLTGLAVCECGRRLTPKSAHGRNKTYNYYRCTNSSGCKNRISAPELEENVLNALGSIRITKADTDKIAKHIRTIMRERATAPSGLDKIKDAQTQAQEKRDRLTAMFEDGLVTKANAETINSALAKANDAFNKATGELEAYELIHADTNAPVEEMVRFARSLSTLRDAIDLSRDNPAELRQHISMWVNSVTMKGDDWEVCLNLPGKPNLKWFAQLSEMVGRGAPKRTTIPLATFDHVRVSLKVA